MKKTTLAASAAVALTAATALYPVSPAFAEPGRDPMGDATVTWADAKAKVDAMWTRLDVNKDGVLNQADREAKMAEMFDMIDTNHDGSISKAEFMEHHKKMMDGPGWKDGKGRIGRIERGGSGEQNGSRGSERGLFHDVRSLSLKGRREGSPFPLCPF